MNRTLVLLFAAAGACSRPNTAAAPDRATIASTATSRASADAHANPNRPPRDASSHQQIQEALALAYPDAPLARAAFDDLLVEIAATADPDVTAARVFAAARRAPPDLLARLWSGVPPTQLLPLARGLGGRARTAGPSDLPPSLVTALEQRETRASVASVVSRMRARLPNPLSVERWMVSSTLDDQLAAARLLASPSTAVPNPALLDLATPFAVPAIVRSLAARADTPPQLWGTLLTTIANRARMAPRQWGNAWRATRDAAPVRALALQTALRAAVDAVNTTQGLPHATLSWFRCENAAASDKLTGWPELTLRCAVEGHEWIAQAQQAEVLGAGADEPRRRTTALQAIVAAAQGRPQVLEAVATAVVNLPANASSRLVAMLARERDPAVMASLMEALEAHLDHARALPAAVRTELMRAPFQQPEGPTLEARVQAIRLAQALHEPVAVEAASGSQVRAIQLARTPDAGILPALTPAPASAVAPVVLRVSTEAGVFDLELHPEAAPRAVEQLVANARAHRYDGLTFHRVVPGFVAQGGDPRGDGYGGTDQPAPTELSAHAFERGAIGIPLAGLDTGGSQMFIVLADAPHLDGRYPWAGRVRSGMDAVDGLMVGDRIERVDVLDAAD